MSCSTHARRARRVVASVCLALAHTTLSVAAAQAVPDWVTLNGNAAHTGYVPITISLSGAKVLWTTQLPLDDAAGVNPPVTGGGQAYVSTNASFGTGHFTALSLTDGRVQWQHTYNSDSYGGIPSLHAPAFKQGMAYVSTGGVVDAALWGYDAATGELRFRAPIEAQWETYYSPTPQGDGLYMNGGTFGGAYGFDAVSGATQWFASLPQYDHWTPATDDKFVYAYTSQLDVISRKSGKVVATIPDPGHDGSSYEVGCAPVLGSLRNVIVTQNQRMLSFDLVRRTVAWETFVPTVYRAMNQLSLADGTIYYGNGSTVYLRDEATGSSLGAWTVPDGGFFLAGSIVVTRNAFIVSATNGTYIVSRADLTRPARHLAAHGKLALSRQGVLVIAGSDGTITGVQLRGGGASAGAAAH